MNPSSAREKWGNNHELIILIHHQSCCDVKTLICKCFFTCNNRMECENFSWFMATTWPPASLHAHNIIYVAFILHFGNYICIKLLLSVFLFFCLSDILCIHQHCQIMCSAFGMLFDCCGLLSIIRWLHTKRFLCTGDMGAAWDDSTVYMYSVQFVHVAYQSSHSTTPNPKMYTNNIE